MKNRPQMLKTEYNFTTSKLTAVKIHLEKPDTLTQYDTRRSQHITNNDR